MSSKKKVNSYCEPIIKILNDRKKTLDVFEKTISIVKFSKADVDNKQLVKQTILTNTLKNSYIQYTAKLRRRKITPKIGE